MKIDKNIPIPINNRMKYPFKEMEIGDSFHIETDEKGRTAGKLLAAARISLPKKFKTRQDENGVRIWRIK